MAGKRIPRWFALRTKTIQRSEVKMSLPMSGNFGAYHPYHPYHPYLNLCLAGRDGKDDGGPMVQSSYIRLFGRWWGSMIPTKDLLIIQLTVTAGRDGKDGRGPKVQSFPLLSKRFGGLL
jgi:hypothetical protein